MKAFWEVVKEVSTQSVRKEAERLFVLSLAGEPEAVAAARASVLGPNPTPELIAAVEPFLFCVTPPYTPEQETRLRHSDLLVSLPGGPGLTDYRPADTLQVERVAEMQQRILDRRPELRVALGRRLPGFRRLAAEQVVREVSRVNAEFAAVAGIGQAIPVLAPLFPALAGTDILVLTKNQVMMSYRLAAVYGEDLALKARAKEIGAIVGGAFGWRTLARQLLGALPGGLGLPIRAGIAYSGTYAIGKAALMVFDQGRRPTRQEMLNLYEEGTRLASETVDQLKKRLTRAKEELEQEAEAEQKALPVGSEESSVVSGQSSVGSKQAGGGGEYQASVSGVSAEATDVQEEAAGGSGVAGSEGGPASRGPEAGPAGAE